MMIEEMKERVAQPMSVLKEVPDAPSHDFMKNFARYETMVDTFCVIGPNPADAIKMYNKIHSKQGALDEKQRMLDVSMQLQYPEFNRGHLDINEGTYIEMATQAFGKDMKVLCQEIKPMELKRVSTY